MFWSWRMRHHNYLLRWSLRLYLFWVLWIALATLFPVLELPLPSVQRGCWWVVMMMRVQLSWMVDFEQGSSYQNTALSIAN